MRLAPIRSKGFLQTISQACRLFSDSITVILSLQLLLAGTRLPPPRSLALIVFFTHVLQTAKLKPHDRFRGDNRTVSFPVDTVSLTLALIGILLPFDRD